MTERERGPTRDSPQPMLTEMGPRTSNGGGPDAADDTEEELHRLSVYETDPPREEDATPECRKRIVVQIHGQEYALGTVLRSLGNTLLQKEGKYDQVHALGTGLSPLEYKLLAAYK